MLRRLHINADPRGRSTRFLHAAADLGRRPFERVAWPLERRFLWPLRERFAGWGPPGRLVGGGALAALVAAAVAVGVLWPSGANHGSGKVTAVPTGVALAPAPASPATEQSHGPVLRGAAPTFSVDKAVGVSKAGGEGDSGGSAASGTTTVPSAETTPLKSPLGATASSAEPVPAGPAAMKVARRFSNAFVFYEVGERQARAKTVFGETADPALATALAERPPRLPEDTKVPKARVVNLVPGPRLGKAYTVSVSLLRIGLTSELRLELEKKQGEWTVTGVRG